MKPLRGLAWDYPCYGLRGQPEGPRRAIEKMKRLTQTLATQLDEGTRLDGAIRANLAHLGYRVDEESTP